MGAAGGRGGARRGQRTPLAGRRSVGQTPSTMAKPVPPIPEGFRSITPYLVVKGVRAALDFYQRAFGAEVVMKIELPGGVIGHAEVKFGDSMVMMGEESPEMGFRGPKSLGGSATGICFYVPDCDAVADRAVKAGAKVLRPMADQFYGDRSATLEDPFGHVWTVSTHKEDLTPEEIRKRMPAQGC